VKNGKKQQFDKNNSVANPKTNNLKDICTSLVLEFQVCVGSAKTHGYIKRLCIFCCVFAIFEREMKKIFL
jgi:hypothetical protein